MNRPPQAAPHRKGLPRSGFPLPIPAALRYPLALLFSACALAATHSSAGMETEHFYLFLLLGVLGSAWAGGWPAGALASAITGGGAFAWMYHPAHGTQTPHPASLDGARLCENRIHV